MAAKKKKANPVGRPTKYSKTMLNKANHYVENIEDYNQVIPSVAGLAICLNVNRSTIYEWADGDKHPEFSNTLSALSDFQEMHLLNNGLNGTFNSTITKLILTNHGYSEKNEAQDDEPAPPLSITFEVKDPVQEISITNAKT